LEFLEKKYVFFKFKIFFDLSARKAFFWVSYDSSHGQFIVGRFIAGLIHRGSIHRKVDSSQGRFIARSIHRKVDSSQGRFIARSIHRKVDSSQLDSSQGWLIAGRNIAVSIHCRVDSSQGRFIVGRSMLGRFIGELCQLKTWLKREIFWLDIQNRVRFVVKTFCSKNYWKASFTEIYLIEMYNFWSEHENWVRLVVKSFSSPPDATEKLVLPNCRQTGSAIQNILE
jgi:hypothetical protein